MPGAKVTVNVPGKDPQVVTVGDNGKWEVPLDTPLTADQQVTATQEEQGKNPSTEVTKTVEKTEADRTTPQVAPIAKKVGDPISNEEITGAVTGLPEGATKEVKTPVTTDEAGQKTAVVTVTYKDGSKEDVEIPVNVAEKEPSTAPTIDKIDTDDTKITGTGVPGAKVTVNVPGKDTPVETTVGEDGNWEVPLDAPLAKDAEVSVVQNTPGKDPSEPATATVTEATKTPTTVNVPTKTPVVDPDNLTDDEKTKVEEEVKRANPNLPEGTTVVVGNDGTVTITEPGKNPVTLTPSDTIVEKDTDGDGFTDKEEKEKGSNPEDPKSTPNDKDGDGATNEEEEKAGSNPEDPKSTPNDKDGDGATNEEEENAGSNPEDPKSTPNDIDGDGIPNTEDPDMDGDGVNNEDEKAAGTDPMKKDSDGNGITDGNEDSDKDGIPNKDESDPNGTTVTDRNEDDKPDITTPVDKNQDIDKDGSTDVDESEVGSDPNDPKSTPNDIDGDGIPNTEDPDIDGDGVNNEDEKAAGTDPMKKDSDGNGITDGDEDADKDGIPNKDESDPNGTTVTDKNKDGNADITTPATDAEKNNPTNPTKTPVEDPNKLTDSEKDKVKMEVEKVNKDLPKGSTITVGEDGTVTITYPDKSTDTITPDLTVVEEKGNGEMQGTQADNTDPMAPAKTIVKDPMNLTKAEKDKVKMEVEKANKDLPKGSIITVGNDGTVTITYPDGSMDKISGMETVSKENNGKVTVTNVMPKTGIATTSSSLLLASVLGLLGLGGKKKEDEE